MDDADLEKRIAEVKHIKRFGEEELGLKFGKAFKRVETDKPVTLYFLYASYKDRIETPRLRNWPENIPYKPYKRKDSALRGAKRLREQGFDTYLLKAEIYADADCPISQKLLLEERTGIRASWILHEGMHLTHDLKKWGLPYILDEHIASYVGDKGARLYLEKHKPEDVPEMQGYSLWWRKVARFVNRYTRLLTECYERGGCPDALWAKARKAAQRLDLSDEVSSPDELNNAFFVRYRDYVKHADVVWKVLDGVDLRDYIANPDSINARLLEMITEQKD